MGIEKVDVIYSNSLQGLIQARQKILSGSPFAIGPGPHIITCLGRDQDFVSRQILENFADVHLSRTIGRAIVIG